VKSAVEALTTTRVRLTVEVPFSELTDSVNAAYRKLAGQVKIKGFRPGKVPPRIVDSYVGRGTVLSEAVNESLPRLYGDALREHAVAALGPPEVEVTKFEDGDALVFTAEVDVRPTVELPDYQGLPAVVDDADVTDAEIDEQLAGLRERFAILSGVDRAVQSGDYAFLDLAVSIEGAAVEDASATGVSYRVGSNGLLDGLDDAVLGQQPGAAVPFRTTLRTGERAHAEADVTVTVRSVKVKEVPELDDEFASTASEFDTLAELRDDISLRMGRVKLRQQGLQARDRVLEALLARVELDVPERALAADVAWRQQGVTDQLAAAGLSKEQYLDMEAKSPEEFDREISEAARTAMKTQFVLEAVAQREQIEVSQGDLTEGLLRRAEQSGLDPTEYAQRVVSGGHIGTLAAEVLRGKALAVVLEGAVVTDASGRPVDLDAIGRQAAGATSDAEDLTTSATTGPSPSSPGSGGE